MIDRTELRKSMSLFSGPAYDPIARDEFIKEMQIIGAAKVLPMLADLFSNPDLDMRINAITAALIIDRKLGFELVLPYLNGPDRHIRYHVCGLMHEFGNQQAVEPLLHIINNDSDPDVRGAAAFGLGGIGEVNAIADLLKMSRNDHEPDSQDYAPSQSARQAIHQILLRQVIAHLTSNSDVRIQRSYSNGGYLEGQITYLPTPINWNSIHQELPKDTFEYTQSWRMQAESSHPLPLLVGVTYRFTEIQAGRKFVFTNDDKQWAVGMYMSPESDDC